MVEGRDSLVVGAGPRLTLLVVALAFLFAIFAPVIDHHYTERLLTHTHVYVNGAHADHVHDYELPHSHSDSLAAPSSDGIVILPPIDDGATIFSEFGGSLLLLAALIMITIPRLRTIRISSASMAYRSYLAIPESPPPRHLAF